MPRPRVRPPITVERVRELLAYNPNTGEFRWKVTRRSRNRQSYQVGDLAGTPCKDGYYRISLDNIPYLGHRLAWLLVHGYWPEEIDHLDRNKSNNRLSNLKACNRKENMQNVWLDGKRRDHTKVSNQTGYPLGVMNAATGKVSGKIYKAVYRNKHIGVYATIEEASAAFQAVKLRANDVCL